MAGLVALTLCMTPLLLLAQPLSAQTQRSATAAPLTHSPNPGWWKASLECPGGAVSFMLRIELGDGGARAWIGNGLEEVEVPSVRAETGGLILDFVHYNSTISVRVLDSGARLVGSWRRRRGLGEWTVMPFRAVPHDPATSSGLTEVAMAGRWAVDFESSSDPGVGVFAAAAHTGGNCVGTFMTTTGDYRYLGGNADGRNLTLSVFDGAHAFLFTARLQDDGTLSGHFWSRDVWHETWTARRDEDAALPDAFEQTTWNAEKALADLRYKTPAGEDVSPADERFAGEARIIEVFGTWCPNCNDATGYLLELDRRYRSRGLSILGLAFEMTGDHAADSVQVRRYIDHHGIEYPILLAGVADKTKATEAFPVLDRVRSYPTFIFIDRHGAVRAIYTGFSGPATGESYDKLRADFERLVEGMLGE